MMPYKNALYIPLCVSKPQSCNDEAGSSGNPVYLEHGAQTWPVVVLLRWVRPWGDVEMGKGSWGDGQLRNYELGTWGNEVEVPVPGLSETCPP